MRFRIHISQVYEFVDTVEVEAEDENAAYDLALEAFRCDWESAIHHPDLTEITFLPDCQTAGSSARPLAKSP